MSPTSMCMHAHKVLWAPNVSSLLSSSVGAALDISKAQICLVFAPLSPVKGRVVWRARERAHQHERRRGKRSGGERARVGRESTKQRRRCSWAPCVCATYLHLFWVFYVRLNTVNFGCNYKTEKYLIASHYNFVILLVFDNELFTDSSCGRRFRNLDRIT